MTSPIRGTEWDQAPSREYKPQGYNIYHLTDQLVRLGILDAGSAPQTAMPNRAFMKRLRETTRQTIKTHPRRKLKNNFTRAILAEILAAMPPRVAFRDALIVALTDMTYRYIVAPRVINKDERLIQVWLQAWLDGEVPLT